MVAELDGRILAAVSIDRCSVIADPFCPIAELVELLRLRAKQFARPRPPVGVLMRWRQRRTM
jgi:hypothetical protein